MPSFPHSAPAPNPRPSNQPENGANETFSTPGWRFFSLVGLFLLTLCAGYAAAILHSVTWAEARQLDAICPFFPWNTRLFSAQDLRQAWQLLAALAGAGGIGTGALAFGAPGRREVFSLGKSLHAAWQALVDAAVSLTTRERYTALGLLAALTLLRAYLSQASVTPERDDAGSYALFVSQGLFATATYYPVPNNHVLSNILDWLFYRVNPDFWWTMRLPVLLTTTATTVLLFLGLRHWRLAFRPAVVAVLLFSLSKLIVHHSAVGRGYWLLTAFAAVVFFATLALTHGTRQPRAAWVLLVVSGVLGAYTVPTFALVIASAFSWLGYQFGRQRAAANILRLGVAGLLVVAATLLLYAPMLFVSGPTLFFSNGYVTAHPFGEFLAGLPTYLWQSEGFLTGQMQVGAVLTVLVGVGSAVLMRRASNGQLPAEHAVFWRQLAPAAWWFYALPYAIIVAKRVFAPDRTLLYKAFFLFVLLAMVVEWLLRHPRLGQWRGLRPWLGTLAIVWTSYQLVNLWRDNRGPHQQNVEYHAAFTWLARQPRGPVLVPEPRHSIFLRLYFKSELPAQTWQLDGRPHPGRAYQYVVAFPNKRGYFQPKFTYEPAFRNAEVEIFRVPTVGPAPAGLPPYWYLHENP
ncbi:hypothetical protein IC235_10945 [Hymenobacter sp. BT664]|uniref:Glycosyltransferase RgtA/B/C/D-like domain-containing protein n=1 Tax=Hymenobacter montanus TaxID=2771359 RepID=A0A927BDZ2_9BACT|nr:hypothetical protein [Hymenobacter montanus]MBD2768409.1 hypothetical protein [Hymenobacter montanus]